MQLRQVEHFRAVAEQGSFTGAARSVRIVQSALSSSIRNLERELGVALFERTTRRVTLTEAGRAFLPHARRLLAEARAGVEAVGAVAGLERGRVAIGFVQWLGPLDLPAELAAFHRMHPGVRITVQNSPVNLLREQLRAGELDLTYLISDEPLPEDLIGVTAYREEMALVTPADHPLAARRRVRWAELTDHDLVDFDEQSAVSTIERRVFRQLGLPRRVVGQVTQLTVQLDLVAGGLGVSVMQRTMAESKPGVAVVRLVEPAVVLDVQLVCRAPGPTNPAAIALHDHLVAAGARLG